MGERVDVVIGEGKLQSVGTEDDYEFWEFPIMTNDSKRIKLWLKSINKKVFGVNLKQKIMPKVKITIERLEEDLR